MLTPETVCPLGSITALAEPVLFRIRAKLGWVVGWKVGIGLARVVSACRADIEGNMGLRCMLNMTSQYGKALRDVPLHSWPLHKPCPRDLDCSSEDSEYLVRALIRGTTFADVPIS